MWTQSPVFSPGRELQVVYQIQHITEFNYSGPVTDTLFEVRMAPRSDEDQTVLSYNLVVSPRAPLMSYRDGFGNRVDVFNLSQPYQALSLQATSFVRPHRRDPQIRLAGLTWNGQFEASTDTFDFVTRSTLVEPCPELESLKQTLEGFEAPAVKYVERLVELVRGTMKYDKKVTTEQTKLREALRLGRGVCQDFAHVLIGLCRQLGLPARYVSGYVNQPGEIATHAWCQIWAGPRIGWIDIDPTSDSFGGNDHVVTAVGRDYADVPPNRGVWKGDASETMDVKVKVEEVEQLPTTLDEWASSAHRRQPASSWSHQRIRRRPLPIGARSIFPQQARPSTLLYRQQGQQQQQVGRPV